MVKKKQEKKPQPDLFEENSEPSPIDHYPYERARLSFPNIPADADARGAGAWVSAAACIICGDVAVAVLAPFTRNPYCAEHWPIPT